MSLARAITTEWLKFDGCDFLEDCTIESSGNDLDNLEYNSKISEKAKNCFVLFFKLGDESERELNISLTRRLSSRLRKDAKMKLSFYRSSLAAQDLDGAWRSEYLICFIGMTEYDLNQWASLRNESIRLDPIRAIKYGRDLNFPLANRTFLPGDDFLGKWLPTDKWQNIFCGFSTHLNTNIFEHRRVDPETNVFDVCNPGENSTPFTHSERLQLSYEKIFFPTSFSGAEIPLFELTHKRGHPLFAIFPLHTESCKLWFLEKWLKRWNLKTLFKVPLDELMDYFGVPIGFYFGFAQFYIRFLIPLSIVGVCYHVVLLWKRVPFPAWFGEIMVLIVIFWNVIFVEMWKRRESELRMKWGMCEVDRTIQREKFLGKWRIDKVTGELTQLPYKKVYCFRRIIGFTGLFVLVSIILAMYAFIFWVRWMRTKVGGRVCIDGNAETNHGCSLYRCVDSVDRPDCGSAANYVRHISTTWQILLAIFNSIQILVTNKLFTMVSSYITEWENHKTCSNFDNYVIVKLFAFRFVNAFMSLFYLSYMQHDIEKTGYNNDEIIEEVGIQLGALFASSMLLQNFMELYRSKLTKKLLKFLRSKAQEKENINLSPAEVQFELQTYQSTLDDMCELVIEYGYVTMFMVAFPLVPLIALLSAIVEIRLDGYKLLYCCRRPIPYNTPGLGMWIHVLDFFAILSVLNNVMLCVRLTDWPSRCLGEDMDTITARDKIFLLLTVSGILGSIVLMSKTFIPNVPKKIQNHMERQRLIEDIICKGQKLDHEIIDRRLQAQAIYQSNELTDSPKLVEKFLYNRVSEKHLDLVARRSSINEGSNIGSLHKLHRWKGSLGEMDEKGGKTSSSDMKDLDTVHIVRHNNLAKKSQCVEIENLHTKKWSQEDIDFDCLHVRVGDLLLDSDEEMIGKQHEI